MPIYNALQPGAEQHDMIKLHHHPYSQHARRVVALLEAVNIPYEIVPVAMHEGEHMSPEYMALNPNHQVPTFTDGNVRIHESNAILRYICNRNRLLNWYPEDADKRAMVDQWLDWNLSRLSQPVIDIVKNTLFMGKNADLGAIERGKQSLDGLARIIGDTLGENMYLTGKHATIADLSIASNVTQLQLADTALEHPTIDPWYQRLCAIDGFAKSLPSDPSTNK